MFFYAAAMLPRCKACAPVYVVLHNLIMEAIPCRVAPGRVFFCCLSPQNAIIISNFGIFGRESYGKGQALSAQRGGYLAVCARWLALAALVGVLSGRWVQRSGLALNWVTPPRGPAVAALPAAHRGPGHRVLYSHFDPDGGGSTNQVFVSVREQSP